MSKKKVAVQKARSEQKDLSELKQEVEELKQEITNLLEAVKARFEEEKLELGEKGLIQWIDDNRGLAIGVGIALLVVAGTICSLF